MMNTPPGAVCPAIVIFVPSESGSCVSQPSVGADPPDGVFCPSQNVPPTSNRPRRRCWEMMIS